MQKESKRFSGLAPEDQQAQYDSICAVDRNLRLWLEQREDESETRGTTRNIKNAVVPASSYLVKVGTAQTSFRFRAPTSSSMTLKTSSTLKTSRSTYSEAYQEALDDLEGAL